MQISNIIHNLYFWVNEFEFKEMSGICERFSVNVLRELESKIES